MTTTPPAPSTPVSLPCLVCGTALDDAFADQTHNQPADGTMFTSHGNYGSTVFDPMNNYETLEVNVCDKCLVAAARNGRVLHVTTLPGPAVVTEVPWDVSRREPAESTP